MNLVTCKKAITGSFLAVTLLFGGATSFGTVALAEDRDHDHDRDHDRDRDGDRDRREREWRVGLAGVGGEEGREWRVRGGAHRGGGRGAPRRGTGAARDILRS